MSDAATKGASGDLGEPERAPRRASDWFALARASNLPTVWSNALVGWAVATSAAPGVSFVIVAVALSLLYTAGMIFNDVCDVRIDARERPQRPIASGRVSVTAALVVVVALVTLAILLLGVTQHAAVTAAGILTALIVLYDLLHGRSATTVLLMAACRAMVIVVAGCAAPFPGGWPLPAVAAATACVTLGVFIVGLSLVARLEMDAAQGPRGVRRAAPLLLAATPLLALPLWREPAWWWPALAGAAFIAWTLRGARHALARPPRRGAAVATWLAGISLLDAVMLTLLDRPLLALVAVGCWLLTLLGHRVIAAT